MWLAARLGCLVPESTAGRVVYSLFEARKSARVVAKSPLTTTKDLRQALLRRQWRRTRLELKRMICQFRKIVTCACACGCVAGVCAAQDNTPPAGSKAELPVVLDAQGEQTEILFWDQMSAEQRARLWPLLTHEQRLFQWRYMTKEERAQMRKHMTPGERRSIKQRYVVDALPEETRERRGVRKMTPAEKELLRQQVIQVHVEIRRGVPYSCSDPTDCPKSAFRARAAEKVDAGAADQAD